MRRLSNRIKRVVGTKFKLSRCHYLNNKAGKGTELSAGNAGGAAAGDNMVPIASTGVISGLGVCYLKPILACENLDKLLEQSIIDLEEELFQVKQAFVQAIASHQWIEKQYDRARSKVNESQNNARLAVQKGSTDRARQALQEKKTYTENTIIFKSQLNQQTALMESLKHNLTQLESKISEAKTKQDMLVAGVAADKANWRLHNTISSLNANSAVDEFKRMEACLQSAVQLATLEAGNNIDDELAAMVGAGISSWLI